MGDKLDPADVRAALRLYFAQRKVTHEQFKTASNVAMTAGAFSRFLTGESKDTGTIKNIADYLTKEGFLPLDGPEMTYRASSRFFHTQSEEQCSQKLNFYAGHYHCYQLSSWFEGLVTISHLEIRPPRDNELFSEVIEKQYSGSPSQRAKIGELIKEDVDQDNEDFIGCCFYSHNSFVFLLLSVELKFIKNIICGVFERNNIAMSGNMQKCTKRQPGSYIHISTLCLERIENEKVANPRIELLEDIEKQEVIGFLRKTNPSVKWVTR